MLRKHSGGLEPRSFLLCSGKVGLSHPFVNCFLPETSKSNRCTSKEFCSCVTLTGWDSRWPQHLWEIITWRGLLFCCYLCCSFTVQEEAPLHFVAVPSECLLLCKSRNSTLEVSFRKRKGMVLRALKVGFSVRHTQQVGCQLMLGICTWMLSILFVFLTILQNMKLGEWWAQMCGNPALCLKPKCVFSLSLTLPKGSV